jgi:hypothetical protein
MIKEGNWGKVIQLKCILIKVVNLSSFNKVSLENLRQDACMKNFDRYNNICWLENGKQVLKSFILKYNCGSLLICKHSIIF